MQLAMHPNGYWQSDIPSANFFRKALDALLTQIFLGF